MELLDALKSCADAFFAVTAVSVEVNSCASVASAVNLTRIGDRVAGVVNDDRLIL